MHACHPQSAPLQIFQECVISHIALPFLVRMDTLNTHKGKLEFLQSAMPSQRGRTITMTSVPQRVPKLFLFDITPPVSYFKLGDDGPPPGVTTGEVFFLPGSIVVGLHDNPQKRDQDLCFWCHRVIRVKYPPVDGPYGPGRVSWVNMCDSQPHASPSADFSLSRNK